LVISPGLNGSGKTTIAHLLILLYEVQKGCIRIDDVDIRDLPLSQLRSIIGFLPYEPLFFRNTVLENLLMSSPDAPRTRIKEICRLAQIHDVIEAMPQGYNTLIGDDG
jgi:ABC-type multidrug transport system fused ATPase/permease subunit